MNLSSYGLQGAEASMLVGPRWDSTNAMQPLMHGDSSWSGPGGWWKLRNPVVGAFRRGYRRVLGLVGRLCNMGHGVQNGSKVITRPSGLWGLLAILSMLVFAALPLSGL